MSNKPITFTDHTNRTSTALKSTTTQEPSGEKQNDTTNARARSCARDEEESILKFPESDSYPNEGNDEPDFFEKELHESQNRTEGQHEQYDDEQRNLTCISANVQHAEPNMTCLFERFRDVDIICVQGPFWGLIKKWHLSNKKTGMTTRTRSHIEILYA